MNGNIQVEPTRVKLDKQGATALKLCLTVKNSGCHSSSTTSRSTSIQFQVPNSDMPSVAFVQQEKFMENFGNG